MFARTSLALLCITLLIFATPDLSAIPIRAQPTAAASHVPPNYHVHQALPRAVIAQPAAVFPSGVFTTTIKASEISNPNLRVNAGDWRFTFNANGTYTGSRNGAPLVTDGTYTTSDNQITMLDSVCGVRGTYTWRYDGQQLTFARVRDTCAPRSLVLTLKPLRQAQPPPAPVPFQSGTYTTTISVTEIISPPLQVNAGDWVFTFRDNGRFIGTLNTDALVVNGTYVLSGTQITFLDNVCDTPGTYAWALNGNALSLSTVDDTCAPRNLVFTLKPLLKATARSPQSANGWQFTPAARNPVLAKGAAGAWDSAALFTPAAVVQGGQVHLFYTGSISPAQGLSIGYATSTSGITFTKPLTGPVLAPGSGFDAFLVSNPVVFTDGKTWTMYYGGQANPPSYPSGMAIGRATAISPIGPWTRSPTPVLQPGAAGAWDSGYILPTSVISTATGYLMYYEGATDFFDANSRLGLATSPDGVTWTKHNDPATSEALYAASDPVFERNPDAVWEAGEIFGASVLKTSSGYEMFYSAANISYTQYAVGHATSTDGIRWTRASAKPLLRPADDPVASGILELPSVVVKDRTYYLYYDYGQGADIGVSTGTRSFSVYLPLLER